MKKVLIMNGSCTEAALILAARKLGYYVITTGNMPWLIGHKYADEYIMADYSDCEEMLQIATENQVEAVCSCANDFAAISAAYVAEKLNLPGHDSFEITKLLHHKDCFKVFAKENKLFSPISDSYNNFESVIAAQDKYDYPLIIKPVDLTGGKGVSKVENSEEYLAAAQKALETSRIGKIVVEKFIQGSQHGFCTFLINQKVVAVCSNDEYSFVNPYRVEIDMFPATGIERCKQILIDQVEKIANILKLKDGIFHLQYIEDEEGPHIIEVMRRMLGNMYSVPANALMGFDWAYWQARAQMGLSCADFPFNNRAEGCFAYKTILAQDNGRIEKINIPERYQKYIVGQNIQRHVGDVISDCVSEPVGLLFMQFSSQAEMHKVLIDEYCNNIVQIENNE